MVKKNPPANTGDLKRLGFDPWVRKIPGKGNDNPLQYSCLEIPWAEDPDGLQSIGSQSVEYD